MTLSVIGDDSAPNLFTLDNSGTIRVANNVDLAKDSALNYKVSECFNGVTLYIVNQL